MTIKIIKILAIISLVLALGFNLSQRLTAQEDGAEESGEIIYADGYIGPIKILIDINQKGIISEFKILDHNETSGYADELTSDSFQNQFVGKSVKDEFQNGVDVDAISGATISSEAVFKAVRDRVHENEDEAKGGLLLNFKRPDSLVYLILVGLGLTCFFRRNYRLRNWILIFSLIYLGFFRNLPIGMVNINSLFLGKLNLANPLFLITSSSLVLGLFAGQVWCGYLCPFGAFQELIGKLRIKNFRLNEKIDSFARGIKYFLLWFILMIALIFNNPSLGNYEPFGTLFQRVGSMLFWMILAVVLFSNLFVRRFYCRYFCAAGGVFKILDGLRLKCKKRS